MSGQPENREGHYDVLLIEPFYGGSHKELIDLLVTRLPNCKKFTLPAKKWPWKSRTSAIFFAQTIPRHGHYRVLFCSSVLNLAEIVALRPDLGSLKKVIYFHENQLEYPVQKNQECDFQFGYNQILSCMVADKVIFNSGYNMESFLSRIKSHLKLIPSDQRPADIRPLIQPKCSVVYFPLKCCDEKFIIDDSDCPRNVKRQRQDVNSATETCDGVKMCNDINNVSGESMLSHHVSKEPCTSHDKRASNIDQRLSHNSSDGMASHQSVTPWESTKQDSLKLEHDILHTEKQLHILWPHRWEHDKNPQSFFNVLYRLHDEGLSFKVSVLGESFSEIPDHIADWGFQESCESYYKILDEADVVVSTANHEFFGVAMLESVWRRCYPICPNRLVYPEIFPATCLYNTDNQLFKMLRDFCRHPYKPEKLMPQIDFSLYSWSGLESAYRRILAQD